MRNSLAIKEKSFNRSDFWFNSIHFYVAKLLRAHRILLEGFLCLFRIFLVGECSSDLCKWLSIFTVE